MLSPFWRRFFRVRNVCGGLLPNPFQLLEYQWSEGKFDKQTSSDPTRRFRQVYDWSNLNGQRIYVDRLKRYIANIASLDRGKPWKKAVAIALPCAYDQRSMYVFIAYLFWIMSCQGSFKNSEWDFSLPTTTGGANRARCVHFSRKQHIISRIIRALILSSLIYLCVFLYQNHLYLWCSAQVLSLHRMDNSIVPLVKW